jgi:translation initiation factor 1A
MVKNTHGGNKHKGFARKHTISKPSNSLRVSNDENEVYAIVTKMLGNNMFHCYCIDNVPRLGHIRGKFAGGRGKRDNFVALGGWVLIGLREWEMAGEKKMQQCDLLTVYSDMDKERLKDTISENWSILNNQDVTKTSKDTSGDDLFSFTTDRDDERERLVAELNSGVATMSLGASEEKTEEEINIDDI